MFEAAMLGNVRALVYGEWKVIAAVMGHDFPPQRDAMQRALNAGTAGTGTVGFAIMEGELHQHSDALPFTMDHAAAWETSCMMHLYPELVAMDVLQQHCVSTDDCFQMFAADGSVSPEGIAGPDPRKYATAELGTRIITMMAELIGCKASSMLNALYIHAIRNR